MATITIDDMNKGRTLQDAKILKQMKYLDVPQINEIVFSILTCKEEQFRFRMANAQTPSPTT